MWIIKDINIHPEGCMKVCWKKIIMAIQKLWENSTLKQKCQLAEVAYVRVITVSRIHRLSTMDFFTWPHDLNRSTSVGDILVQRCGPTDRPPWIIRKAMAQIITTFLWYYCVHFKWLEDIVVILFLLYELEKDEMRSPTENKIN